MQIVSEESKGLSPATPEPYTLFLGIKEFGFLSLILFLGFTGFSLSVEKIYTMPDAQQIDEITVHPPNISEVKYTSYPLKK